METLYKKLKAAEEVNLNLINAHKDLLKLLVEYKNEEVPGIQEVIDNAGIKPLPMISVPDYQRQIIEDFSSNPVLSDALCRRKSVEAKVQELCDRKYKGFRKFLPKRKDEQYNHDIEELEKLLKPAGQLITTSVLFPDNHFMSVFYTALAGGGVGSLAYYTSGSNASLLPSLPTVQLIVGGVYSFFGLTVGLMAGAIIKDSIAKAKKQANYIDQKIDELF